MTYARRLPARDHHWQVQTAKRLVRHDEIKVLPSGVLEARDQAFESNDKTDMRVVMRTSRFYAPGYWLDVERTSGDQRGNGGF